MKAIAWLVLTMLIGPVVGRDTPLSVGRSFMLHSESLNEDRLVSVYLPEGYDETKSRYPVLYLLDAETHLLHLGSSARLLGLLGEMPRIIVVGVANSDRTRDMTTPLVKPDNRYPTAGGSAKFLSFLRSELRPYIQSNFRTEPFSILAGTSLSGLFVLNTFVSDAESFDAYFAASPSLWWNDGQSADALCKALERPRSRPKFLFISTARGDSESLQQSVGRVLEVLGKRAADALTSQHAFFGDESHNSTPLPAFYDALKWLYSGWPSAEASSLSDLERHYGSLSKRYGYAIEIPDTDINNLAYGFLYSGHQSEAIELFKLNTGRSPGSANAWDSLGEAYRSTDDLTSSESAYRKACALGRKSGSPHGLEYCSNLDSVKRKVRSGGGRSRDSSRP
jgi:predicted alpha/beta superfamily hydrolase